MIEAWLFLRIRPIFQQLSCTTYTSLHGNLITGELLQVDREVVGLFFLVVYSLRNLSCYVCIRHVNLHMHIDVMNITASIAALFRSLDVRCGVYSRAATI